MTNSSDAAEKGYFNALTAGYFKTTTDSRKLFYPWGALGRGYVIPSDDVYERLRGQIKMYMIVSLALIIGSAATRFYFAAIIIAAALIIFYLARTPYLLRGLQPSDERMSVGENMATQARIHNAGTLWLMEIASLAFVAIGIVILVAKPEQWLVALGSIIFFGLCAVVFARMLMLRRREP